MCLRHTKHLSIYDAVMAVYNITVVIPDLIANPDSFDVREISNSMPSVRLGRAVLGRMDTRFDNYAEQMKALADHMNALNAASALSGAVTAIQQIQQSLLDTPGTGFKERLILEDTSLSIAMGQEAIRPLWLVLIEQIQPFLR